MADELGANVNNGSVDEVFQNGVLVSTTAPMKRFELSSEEFMLRFTADELKAIELSEDKNVILVKMRVLSRPWIDVRSIETVQGLSYLVAVGLVTEERKAALLDGLT